MLTVPALAYLLQTFVPGAFSIPGNSDAFRAPRDPATQHMKARPAQIRPHVDFAQKDYFLREIPRTVHQIWFGDPSRMNRENVTAWQAFSAKFGYTYRLWSENDQVEFAEVLSERDAALLEQHLRIQDYWGASDILRLSLLSTFGGVYADLDIMPPSQDSAWVDLASLLPMQNVVLITERDSRSVVDSSLFVGNNFMMSAPHHPLIDHLKNELLANTSALNEGLDGSLPVTLTTPTMYATGPFYISASLAGVFTILPYNYARQNNMLSYDSKRDY